jgi:hypothetical protein
MSRRKWIVLGASLLVLTVGAELAIRPFNPIKGSVQIQNEGGASIDDLVLTYGSTKVAVGRLGAGQTTNVWITPAGAGLLTLEFDQKGNPMKGFKVEDFDPDENLRFGVKLALIIRNNEVVRYMEDDQTRSPLGNLMNSVKEWFTADVQPP